MMKQLGFAVLLFVVTMGGLLMSDQPEAVAQDERVRLLLQEATQAYEATQFSEAAQLYQQVVDLGVQNSTVYYNLGNAYFKQEALGPAILNYERAAQLTPRDGDVRTNLALARQQTQDQLDMSGESLLTRLAQFSQHWLTLSELAMVALSAWFLFVMALLAFSHTRSEAQAAQLQTVVFGLALLLVLSGMTLGARLYVRHTAPMAIILADEVAVVSGPGAQYVTQFTLNSGTTVKLLEQRGGWARLALPGESLQGWVPAERVASVVVR